MKTELYFKKIRVPQNPYILFFPFLILYLLYAILFHDDAFIGDENRYMYFAENLLNGFYSPPPPGIWFDKGPGYSIVLMPLVALNAPLIVPVLLNAIFLYLTIIFLFKTSILFLNKELSLIVSLFWAVYFNSLESLHLMLPEVLSILLVSISLYTVINAFNSKSRKKRIKYVVLSGIIIGYLALTKVIFGYVIFSMVAASVIIWLFNRSAINHKNAFFILLVAALTTLPYLIYTYNLTGKVFYWSSVGGNNLYWMSTPFEEEYGSWYPFHTLNIDSVQYNENPYLETMFKKNHTSNHELFFSLEGVAQDDAYKRIALQNIKNHPIKFLKNCFSNMGRIVFNYPYSYSYQKPATLLRLPFNGIIVVFVLIILLPTIYNWKNITYGLRFFLLFSLTYFGGSLFGSAETRMFTVMVPILIFWIGYILNKTVKMQLIFNSEIHKNE